MRPRLFAALLAAAFAFPLGTAPRAVAGTPATEAAVDWLAAQQRADGSFEVSGFPGFETPDAVAAIAQNAQTGSTWSTSQARTAVEALEAGGAGGPTPLDWTDTWTSGGINAGHAAKLIVLVTAPLGLDARAFDPRGNGAIDLVAVMDGGYASGSYGTFNATVSAALANVALGRTVPTATIALIRASQQADGGWNYAGDPAGDFAEVDTTALAIMALVAAGAAPNDADVQQAVGYLDDNYSVSGGWKAFGSFSPNSTALGMLALDAAGVDFTTGAWRGGGLYISPESALLAYQEADGEFPTYGNTFGTSQAVQGLLRNWLPFAPQTSGDTVSVRISGGVDVSGPVASGDIRVATDSFGVVSVTGTAVVSDADGPASVRFGVQRLAVFPVYVGSVAAGGKSAQVWFARVAWSGATRTASSASTWIDFGSWPWASRTVTWSVTDGS
ncbi:MAG: terpene cyclase/mutase family protein [Acidimicrobiia bacterium]|nr:terpene cyclase/mutase family protein [Acidimicrobiia bacterium]